MYHQFRRGDKMTGGYVDNKRQYASFESEQYIHETIMYLISILQDVPSMDLPKLTVELCKRGNTKPLKKVASGDSVEERVLSFIWQHPSLFSVKDRVISLRPMSDDIDDMILSTLDSRLTEFLVFRCHQYGPCQIPISKLMGNLQQAAADIKAYFHNDYGRFYNFLRSKSSIFTLLDNETVALKQVIDQAHAQRRPLLKCDEYYLDNRVLERTQLIRNYKDSKYIVDYILKTKTLVAVDCEGVNLGAPNGYITLVQLAYVEELPPNFTDEDVADSIRIYLFDVQHDERLAALSLRKILAAKHITKIFQGCSSDAGALYNRYKIVLHSVFDTVIAHRQLHEGAKSDLYYLYEFYVGEVTNRMKKDIKKKYISNPDLWTTRPLTELLTYYAAFDVYALIRIYFKLKSQLDKKTYESIYSSSNASAFSAIRRYLPFAAMVLYSQGCSDEEVAAETGVDIPSELDYRGYYEYPEESQSSEKKDDKKNPFNIAWPTGQKNVYEERTHRSYEAKANTDRPNGNNGYNNKNRNPNHTNNQQHYSRNDRPQRPTSSRHQSRNDNQQRANRYQTQYQPRQRQYQNQQRWYCHNQSAEDGVAPKISSNQY